MKRKKLAVGLIGLAIIAIIISSGLVLAADEALTPKEKLGEFLYFDANLSDGYSIADPGEVVNPTGQSCASCHLPSAGFADPDRGLPVSEGVIFGRFGGRNSPSAAYAMYSPVRYFDEDEGLWIGGLFWDSRATGEVLGDPLADQALGPFLNDVEMANPDKATVIADVEASAYAPLFAQECGFDVNGEAATTEAKYNCVALAIAAFERTALFAPFSSKYDAYLQACLAAGGEKEACATGDGPVAQVVGPGIFSKKEWKGLQLFMGENDNDGTLEVGEGAMCSACHVAEWTTPVGNVVVPAWSPDGTVPPVFTDFTYDNLGVPKSDHILLAGADVDLGLGKELNPVDAEEYGKFKVMSLRNIHQTSPYAHNGFFKSLEDITHFYNTRDVPGSLKKGADWPAPEYPATMNVTELGNLGLTDTDEDALVKFMKTLSDGYVP